MEKLYLYFLTTQYLQKVVIDNLCKIILLDSQKIEILIISTSK